ncbi:MAG: NAD(P)-dependent oxidoreductase [Chloroflexi bacterium]|nr:NAD(P)-dependent oxidoreductase [Chloroflexota bacterium]MYB21542.1 NAD(P)-dependent oxidoreductase [Chloroflexota bacterium]MYD16057.1 NAD(P)-dependent oxidoreductase [Chloroflexota bacterium]MYF82237.1 NAD(P)-dependent oxidoreductase [Chloroflexota bacterium]MYI03584.1 NAD(P)-dependent oxidoreductase [Chloroflexota bacterium]
MSDVGFIGVGNIGNPMCANVIKGGHNVVVHDLVEAQAENLIELGATWAESPAAVAAQTEVVLTSLPGPPEVTTVLRGADGILEGAEPGLVCFDLSTNLPSTVKLLAERAAEQGVLFLDSPVSNGVQGAIDATLAVMVGGDKAAFDAYRHVLECIGSHVFHMGELGMGALTKITNNMVSIGSGQLLIEALVIAEAAGLDAEQAVEVMSVASAQNYVRNTSTLLERNFEDAPFFLQWAAKDVSLAVQVAREQGIPSPMASAASDMLNRAKNRGLGMKSPMATLLSAEEDAGVSH